VELCEVLLDVLRWWDTFLRSPGLGGLAAVAAAWVGFRQWRRQARAETVATLERAGQDARARRDEQWWEVYRLSHASRPAGPARLSPQDERLLRVLIGSAETEIQVAAALAVASAFGYPAPSDDKETADGD
jgi:hypothetical protein